MAAIAPELVEAELDLDQEHCAGELGRGGDRAELEVLALVQRRLNRTQLPAPVNLERGAPGSAHRRFPRAQPSGLCYQRRI